MFALYGKLSDRKNRNEGVTRVLIIKRVGWLLAVLVATSLHTVKASANMGDMSDISRVPPASQPRKPQA